MQSHNFALLGYFARPPDPDIAAGPNHVVTVVNQLVTIYGKTGTQLFQGTLATWFSGVCLGCSPFDPRVAFDPQENRWILVALEQDDAATVGRILLSVSMGSDPTSTWTVYNIDGVLTHPSPSPADTWPDYPDIGFDGILSTATPSGAVYITANQFTFPSTTGSFRTAITYVLPKALLYAGAPLSAGSYYRLYDWTNADGSRAFTLRAAKTYGNPGGEFLINSRNVGDYVTIWKIIPTYPPAPAAWTRQATIVVGSYSPALDAPQLGGCGVLDTIDNRMYNAVWRNNRLYGGFTHAYNWGSGSVAAIRYLKVNTVTDTAEVNNVFGADGVFYWMPAVTVDRGQNIVLTYARSSTGEFAGVHYTGHRVGAPVPETPAQLRAGVQCITGFRWGDYFGAAVDPVETLKSWVFGQWASNEPAPSATWDWGTWIGQTQFPAIFADVPSTDYAFEEVEELYNRGITAGCLTGPLRFCPDSSVSRREMAVFIVKSLGLSPITPCTGVFADVGTSDWACGYIEKMYEQGLTAGCLTGPLRYCPDSSVSRREMAVFLVRGKGLSQCSTAECPTPTFSDVPTTDWGYGWVERLYQQGITGGCATGPLRYCPNDPVIRRQLGVFLILTFFP